MKRTGLNPATLGPSDSRSESAHTTTRASRLSSQGVKRLRDRAHSWLLGRDWGGTIRTFGNLLVGLGLTMALAACSGHSPSASPPGSRPAASSPPASSPSPKLTYPAAAGKPACSLASTSEAAAALGVPVGSAKPAPLASGSANGAKGSTCQWADSHAGTEGLYGSVGTGVVVYPSAAIAHRLFTSSSASCDCGNSRNIPLPPGLAPGESGTVSYLQGEGSPTARTVTAILLAGNQELEVSLSEKKSMHFNQAAFVTLVSQVARVWR
jgi:hypothetical protein